MARPRSEEYPEHAVGSVPYILSELIERDGRSMRAVSLAAGLAGDAVRNALRHADAQPRPKTIEALARALGVDPKVLTGQLPMPAETAKTASPGALKTSSLPVKSIQSGEPRTRRELRDAIRLAMRTAVAGGMSPRHALADVVLAAMLAAVAAGVDDVDAAELVGSIGIQE